ncbi:MAG: TetR/AcrR family transcriptional regulator [Myxococcota bacterium]
MPRKREFDPDKALDAAVEVFWRQGYDATSVADLVEAMGINRFSLYNTFGDKHALFLLSLERYAERVVTMMLGPVEALGASLPQLREYFEHLVTMVGSKTARKGCLMTNSAAELAAADAATRAVVNAHLRRQTAAFRNALANAVAAGEVCPNLDVERYAESLTISAQGLAVYIKTNPPAEVLTRFVDGLFAPLGVGQA